MALQEELYAKQAELIKIGTEKNGKLDLISSFNKQAIEIKEKINNLDGRKRAISEQLDNTQEEIDEQNAELHSKTKNLENARANIKSIEDNVTKSRAQINENDLKADELREKITELEAERKSLQNELASITEDIVTYEQLRDETTNRLATMSQRTTPGEMVANVLANMQTSLGANIASNPVALGIWTVANLMSDSGLDIPIPVPLVGSLSTANLMKLGVIGTGAITSLGNIASAIGSGNLAGTNISAWTDTVERGKGLGVNGVSSGRGLSGSAYIGAYDSENTKAGFSQVESQAEEYTGAKTDEITELIRDHIAPDVSGIKTILESWDLNYFRLKKGKKYITATRRTSVIRSARPMMEPL